MEFSRQEYWSGVPFPSPGDLPNPRTEPGSPTLQADALPWEPPGNSSMLYTADNHSAVRCITIWCMADTSWNMGEPWKQYARWKKSDIKDHILYTADDHSAVRCITIWVYGWHKLKHGWTLKTVCQVKEVRH